MPSSQQKLFFGREKKNLSSPKKGKHKIMTRRVFFLQINLDAPKQKHLHSIREMRNLSRIFLNTSLLCFTNPYVFPKVVKYHFQLKFTYASINSDLGCPRSISFHFQLKFKEKSIRFSPGLPQAAFLSFSIKI